MIRYEKISDNWVFIPSQKIVGIIHFLGGAFVATAPQISYRSILEQICQEGFLIVATPFVNTFDHFGIARNALNRFETTIDRLQASNLLSSGYTPVYGLGHSMGCKLHLLINSLYEVKRMGNILISFNNYPAKKAVPFLDQINIPSSFDFDIEFEPSPKETKSIITKNYNIRRNLLIKFNEDEIDQTASLNQVLNNCSCDMIVSRKLQGNHLTPLSQKIQWETGNLYTPIDAVKQWLNQKSSSDLDRLTREIVIWLNPSVKF